MTAASSQERLHALDAVRGIALLLGIVLHGTMSFMPSFVNLGWPIADVSQSSFLQIVFFVIHIFRMATFFLIAGFFAHLVMHSRGTRHFVKNRKDRILGPLLIWFAPVALCTVLVIIWADQTNLTGASLAALGNLNRDSVLPFPLLHFWFLYILIWLYTMTLPLRGLVARFDANQTLRLFVDRQLARLFENYLGPFVLAAPIAVVLASIPQWSWWGGIPTPDYSLDPPGHTLSIYFYVFSIGWLLDRQRHLLSVLKRQWVLNLIVGMVTTIACLTIAEGQSDLLAQAIPEKKLMYASCYAVAILALSFSFIGAGMKFFSNESPVVRYLADASYWMYLWHLPVVFAFQTLLMNLGLHWVVKFPLIVILTCVPLVFSYDRWVRSTEIGELMNGRRYPRGLPGRQSLPTSLSPINDAQT